MNDRDVPSVPVTTLAGLTSLSDLLSELPVSESFCNGRPITKSLLFHTLVANESNNLLSVRDDNLVRQLVNAIEQTNSDKIELKPQFVIPQHGANINAYPELLQGIYNYRPTVFNTILRKTNIVQHQKQYQHQEQGDQTGHDVIQQSSDQNSISASGIQNVKEHNLIQQQINFNTSLEHQLQLGNIINASTMIGQHHQLHFSNEIPKRQTAPREQLTAPKIQEHPTPQTTNEDWGLIKEDCDESLTPLHNEKYQQTSIVPIQEALVSIQNENSGRIIKGHMHQHHTVIATLKASNQNPQQEKFSQDEKDRRQHSETIQENFQNVLSLDRLQMQKVAAKQNQQEFTEKSPQDINLSLLNHQPNKTNVSTLSSTQAAIVTESHQQQTLTHISILTHDKAEHKAANTQSNNANLVESSLSSSDKSQVRVCINRLKAKDARLMQQSIQEFIQKSPELAKKLGLPVTVDLPANNANASDSEISLSTSTFNAALPVAVNNINAMESSTSVDAFSAMKADERRVTTKRKLAISIDNMPPEQIFSNPKVRRVVRIISVPSPQFCKEEVLRSQTYQQFMHNMEQINESLEDTESPNFDSDDVDQNIECISSKMLNTVSSDAAKLKAKQALDSVPKNQLTLLINYAMRNVYIARNYSAGPDDEDEIVDDEVMEKILNAVEACLLICNIYSTANDIQFLQEDNISLIIKFVQFQFRATIFSSYDPVYTVKSMKKNDNRKKSKAHQNHNRSLQLLYSKTVELIKVLVTLFDKCVFVDTIVLPLSTLAIEPFFVDNIETLQFVCLELVTTIFRNERYDKIRSSILGDILSSIDRLPSSKKNLRPFKLTNNGGNIQMVTALVLQLIQCSTILPDSLCNNPQNMNVATVRQTLDDIAGGENKIGKQNQDVVVLKKYDVAVSIGGNFLTTFLNKCKSRSNETDFRPLFENFIHDLLATVNKPEWPASELLLSLLGTMLVRYVSDKTIEQTIRLVSLDYIGIVAARLRKDTVESRCKVNIIDSMIKSIKVEQEKEGDLPSVHSKIKLDPDEERSEFLQKILLDFLAVNAQEDNLIWDYARHFYLAQWYRDVIYQRRRISEGEKGYASRKKGIARKKRRKVNSSDSESCNDSGDESNSLKNGIRDAGSVAIDQELNLDIFSALDDRKRYLLGNIKPYFSASDMNHTSLHIKTYIDYNNAQLIAQYLATKRPFSQSFDGYLKKIILVVNEPSIAIRTRAMKCLANIVEVDPMVLKRKDMQMGVNQKFLDAAISVREAAVDLIGKFVLSNEELIDQYYDMLSTRILDTGVSVRKRVIKILRDICIEYPDFKKIPEICVKMIRRVNDEEGIQKLVTEVFMKMWFTPCQKNDQHGVQRKISHIIDVVNTAHDTGTSWLEGLLNSIFQPKENVMKLDGSSQEPVKKSTEPPQEIVMACQQLADGLVDRLIELEDTDNARMLGCVTTLHLLAKVQPQLLVRHAMTIEPYLNIKCHPATAPKFICAVADILEKVVPLVNYASESFLASLEEHLMLLVVSLNQAVVTSCVSCLGALVNKITKNYKLIRDCFQKFYRILDYSRNQVVQNNHSIDSIYTPMFRRSLFTIGILMRYFDFKSVEVIGETNGGLPSSICDDAFECLMYFIQCSNHEIRKQSLIALGSFCVMNDDYLTNSELKHFYCNLLQSDTMDPSIKIICMRNIWIYLNESEMCMHNREKEWEKQAKHEDLKEMNDVSSGMASRIIQLYLQEILECFLHRDDAVRLWAVKVVQIVLRQGLVHPVRMVPYLICLSTDCKLESAHRADALLKDIDKTYAGFVNMKVQFGLQLCFKLQEILQYNDKEKTFSTVIRGYNKRESDAMPFSLNDFLYTLLRTTKPQRRALVQTVTKQFDDQKTSLRQMLYIADNLAYFPYIVQDEPLYLIHQIDLLISMAGTNLLSTFKECLKPGDNLNDILEDDDDVEDPEVLFERLPENTTEIQKCITSAQACMLLLILKEHLKEMYSLTDSKISRYSPSEQKIYEKSVTRKNVPDFNPSTIIDVIKKQQEQRILNTDEIKGILSDEEKMDLILKYLDFKKLMLKLDPDDTNSEDETRDKLKVANSTDIAPTTSNTIPAIVDTSNTKTSTTSSNLPNNKNMSYFVPPPDQVKETSVSALRSSKSTILSIAPKVNMRKQPQRGKRRKRKMISSDEDNDDYSDEDCA